MFGEKRRMGTLTQTEEFEIHPLSKRLLVWIATSRSTRKARGGCAGRLLDTSQVRRAIAACREELECVRRRRGPAFARKELASKTTGPDPRTGKTKSDNETVESKLDGATSKITVAAKSGGGALRVACWSTTLRRWKQPVAKQTREEKGALVFNFRFQEKRAQKIPSGRTAGKSSDRGTARW